MNFIITINSTIPDRIESNSFNCTSLRRLRVEAVRTSIVGTDLITVAQYYAPCGGDAAVASLRRLLSN